MVSEVLEGLILKQANDFEGIGGISFVKHGNRCFSLSDCVWNRQQESSKQQPVSHYGSFHSIWFFWMEADRKRDLLIQHYYSEMVQLSQNR